MCGPTGVGFLYGRHDILLEMPPFLGEILNNAVLTLHCFFVNQYILRLHLLSLFIENFQILVLLLVLGPSYIVLCIRWW